MSLRVIFELDFLDLLGGRGVLDLVEIPGKLKTGGMPYEALHGGSDVAAGQRGYS